MSETTNPCGEITLPGDELVAVKPMGMPLPSGILYYFDYTYESNKTKFIKAMESEAEIIELVEKYYDGNVNAALEYIIKTHNSEVKTLNYAADHGQFEQLKHSMIDVKSTIEIMQALINIKMPKREK